MNDRDRNVEKIVNNYAAFLKPIVGEGDLSDRLIAGLDNVLQAQEIEEVPEIKGDELLDQKIDYSGIRVGSPKTAKRIRRVLAREGIDTYRQLIEKIDDIGDIGIRGLGKHSSSARWLLSHLDVKGIVY
jgi:hypothetical protein